MNRTGLILAAHGSRVDPSTNVLVRRFAARLDALRLFDEVTPAFHRGDPGFCAALDGLAAPDVTVVPLMTSQGHFCDSVLPSELRKSRRFGRVHVRQTTPVGTHPGIVRIVADRVAHLLRTYGMPSESTSLAIIGHGTPRHGRSRDATLDLVEAARQAGLCAEVLPAFLDEIPAVESIAHRVLYDAIIAVPFLIGRGAHATIDIPRRIGLRPAHAGTPSAGFGAAAHRPNELPIAGRVGGRFVVCDASLGTADGMLDLLIDLARPDRARGKGRAAWA